MNTDLYTLIENAKLQMDDFYRLVDMYNPMVYRWCKRLTGNEEDIKDIMQEAFIRLYQDIPRLRDNKKFNGWFKRVVINTAYDWFRKHKKKLEMVYIENLIGLEEQPLKAAISESDDSQLGEYIKEAIEKLSENNRIVFSLFYQQGIKCSDIASMLDITENAVKNRLMRARDQLRNELSYLQELNFLVKDKSFRILVLCCSHRRQGVSLEIAEKLKSSVLAESPASNVIIEQLSEYELSGCEVCYECSRLRKCKKDDGFNKLFDMCVSVDAIVIISPYYAPIPSKLSILLERLMAITISPLVTEYNTGRAYPLQKKWCAVLNFSLVQKQGYMASIIREPLVSMGMGFIATEDKLSCDASIFEHGELLGRLIVGRLTKSPNSNAIDNWFDYWNEENLKIMDMMRKHEIEGRLK